MNHSSFPFSQPSISAWQFIVHYSPFLLGALEDAVRAVSCISEVASFENADSSSFSWFSPTFLISLSCDSRCCASHIGVNKAPILTVFISMIPQFRSLKNYRNYSHCHRKREIKTRKSYCLSGLSCLTLLVKDLSAICKVSRGCYSPFCRWWHRDPLSVPPTRVTRKQRTNKLGHCYVPQRSLDAVSLHATK